MRLRILVPALVAGCALLAWQLGRSGGLRLPLFDFVEYWAAGRLNARGEDPYDPDRVHELERQAGRTAEGVLMWNPPWTLSAAMPFGLFPPEQVHAAHLLWLLLQLAALLSSADVLWRHYGGDPARRWLAWLVAFTFLPTLLALTAGQISPLLLLGAVLFLRAARGGRFALAGAAAALLAIKPHLVYLFWPAVLLWAAERRRWALLAGGALAGLAATAVPLLCNPDVLGQYLHTFTSRPPEQYPSPTLGTLLRLRAGEDGGLVLDKERFWLQFVPLLPGLLWFAWYWLRHRREWDWDERLPMLLLVSALTSPYGAWPFDLVVLLVPVLRVAARLDREGPRPAWKAARAYHLAVNGLALALVALTLDYIWFIWMTPALLLGCVALDRRREG